MSSGHRRTDRWANGHCDCHVEAMGHVFSEDLVCTNQVSTWGERARCTVTFAAHQLDPQPCALAGHHAAEEAA